MRPRTVAIAWTWWESTGSCLGRTSPQSSCILGRWNHPWCKFCLQGKVYLFCEVARSTFRHKASGREAQGTYQINFSLTYLRKEENVRHGKYSRGKLFDNVELFVWSGVQGTKESVRLGNCPTMSNCFLGWVFRSSTTLSNTPTSRVLVTDDVVENFPCRTLSVTSTFLHFVIFSFYLRAGRRRST